MYYIGDLQTGIATAVTESKCLVCFITDGGDESTKWDEEWLQDHNLPILLERKAITMMFTNDSDEAKYFNAVCPINTEPFLAVVYQGQVVERLTSGISKNDFTRKLLLVLTRPGQVSKSPAAASSSSPNHPAASSPAPAQPDPQQGTSSNTPHSVPANATAATSTPADQDRVLLRDNRHEAQREKSADRKNKRHEEDAISGATDMDVTKKLPQSRLHAEEQVIRNRDAREELDRVRKQVEYDKQARRERNEYTRAASAGPDHETEIAEKPASSQRAARNSSGSTRLQVRLLDGSAIRATFDPSTSLSAVRKWLDSSRTDGDLPYSLKQLMTPAPSRPVGDQDSERSLQDLGLHPSATLVMTPLQGLAAAYQQSPSGAAQTIAGIIWTYIVAVVLWIISTMKTFLGLGERPQQGRGEQGNVGSQTRGPANSEASASGAAVSSSDNGPRIRSLKDQRRETTVRGEGTPNSEHQLYNGGGLNFEPRQKDEEDAKSKPGQQQDH